eukprot:PLAT3405.1.p1 GENE.PLAT3405.1~~PLAT3405.1.p1  ORF type:complete len:412 (+),score=112.47 PLAT3405.1:44-1237(+)
MAEEHATRELGDCEPAADHVLARRTRDSRMIVHTSAPAFNAEVPAELLTDSFITPTPLFFKRNHAPVPLIDGSKYRLTVDGIVKEPLSISLAALKERFEKVTIAATLQCAGNRRTAMKAVKDVRGVPWGPSAVGTATWTGVLLRDVLLEAGLPLPLRSDLHVEFEGIDPLPPGKGEGGYGSSIPLSKAMSIDGDVLLAYSMNGEPLPADHGYPLRVVVPGFIGARSVKWLKRISVRVGESDNFYQARDYKLFRPSVDWDSVDALWDSATSIQEYPVNSFITSPKHGERLSGPGSVQGYALAGGGRRIIRVDVSLDGGRSWTAAKLQQMDSERLRHWTWTLWSMPVVDWPADTEIVVRAWDDGSNTQPQDVASVWNLRGVISNAWHRVKPLVLPASKL